MTDVMQTPIYRAIEHATRDDDQHIRDAARRVLRKVPQFAILDEAERALAYDEINGAGALNARCDMAKGMLTRQEILCRASVDLAYAYIRNLYALAAGSQGLDTMSDLALRMMSHIGHEKSGRLN